MTEGRALLLMGSEPLSRCPAAAAVMCLQCAAHPESPPALLRVFEHDLEEANGAGAAHIEDGQSSRGDIGRPQPSIRCLPRFRGPKP